MDGDRLFAAVGQCAGRDQKLRSRKEVLVLRSRLADPSTSLVSRVKMAESASRHT